MWLDDLIYGIVNGVTGGYPDSMSDSFFVDHDLLTAIQLMWTGPENLLYFVLYWLFVGLLIVGLFALFRWIFTFTFRLFRLD